MVNMWTAASDRDYYDPHGLADPIEDEYPWDELTPDELSLYMSDPALKGGR